MMRDVRIAAQHLAQGRHADALPRTASPPRRTGSQRRRGELVASAAIGPEPLVVRSSVSSWWTTTTPSADRWTSSSRPSAPAAIPRSNAAMVFSGPRAHPPRWAKTERTVESKKGTMLNASVMPSWQRLAAQIGPELAASRAVSHLVPLSIPIESPMSNPSAISTLGELRRAVDSGTVPHRSVHEEVRDNLIREAARAASRSSPASSATTTPSSRSWSTRCCRSTTSSCSACAARPRRGCCARWSRCSTSRSR